MMGAGGAVVAVGGAGGGAPHGQVAEQVGAGGRGCGGPPGWSAAAGGGGADLLGEVVDEGSPRGEVGTPLWVLGEGRGGGGEPREGPGSGVAEAGVVEAPVEDCGAVPGGVELT